MTCRDREPVLDRCARCDRELSGRQRKWCSENCRKRAADEAHRATCCSCGVQLAARSGWSHTARINERCQECEKRLRREIHEVRLEDFAAMYNEGLPLREITRRLGYSESSHVGMLASEARRRGLIGYRYRRQAPRTANPTAVA